MDVKEKMSFALKYQAFLDKINNRVPIKWLTRPIDRIYPLLSLILFILIILGILLLIFKPFGLAGEKTDFASFTIGLADNEGTLLKNFEFKIKDYKNNITQTYYTGTNGQFSLQLDKFGDYSIIVDKKGYKPLDQEIDLSKTKQNFIIEIFSLPSTQAQALTFVSTNGQRITENLEVTIACQDGTAVTPTPITVTNGSKDFVVPTSCTTLVATAIGTTYSGNHIQFNQNTGVVTVPPRSAINGSGRVSVRVKSGLNYLEGITLNIFKLEDGVNAITTGQTTAMGAKLFSDLEVGEYKVIATDDLGRYQPANVSFVIQNNTESQITVDMLSSTDSITPMNAREIRVILKEEGTTTEFSTGSLATVILTTDSNGTTQNEQSKNYVALGVRFTIDASKQYSITARAPGYVSQTQAVTPNVSDYIIYLERETEENVSDINVTVIDEDNLPVIGATLIIYDGLTDYQDTRFDSIVTDEFGKGIFEDIPRGNYFIKLRKTNVVSSSAKFTHSPPTDTNLAMNIRIGEGTINLNIKNINEEAINFANIKIFNANGTEIGSDQSTQDGTYTRRMKADKIVYVKISKEGYYDYYTELLTIINTETISKDIRLVRTGTASVPIAEFVGLYNQQDQKATFLTQNSKYYFKFRLTNPATTGNIGLRIQVGEENIAAEDIAYIKPINNTKAAVFYYGSTALNIVQSDTPAKIADARFVNVTQGVYELHIPIATIQATRGQAVPIYYSVYTNTAPTVDSLNNQQVFYIDVSEICSDNFCISGQYVDTEADIVYDLEETNNLVVNKNYDLSYTLTNAKSNVFTNNRLSITNVESSSESQAFAIDIASYIISGGDFNSSGSAGGQIRHKIPFTGDYINSTQINVYDKIDIDTRIKPTTLGQTRFLNTIISEQAIVYNEFINFGVTQQYPFTITYSPENIVPGKPFNLTVNALDETGMPITNARVNVYQRLANNQQVTITAGTHRTDDYGKAIIPMPSLKNAERIIISVEKSGYYATPIEITISLDILELKQGSTAVTDTAPFTININKANPQGTEKVLTIVNNTDYTLRLKNFRDDSFSFRYPQYLNVGQLQQYLNGQTANIVIPANDEGSLRIKLATSQDAINLNETIDITGSIVGYVTVDNSITEYPFNIPVNVKISVGEGVEEDDCLVVQGTSNPWQEVVSGNDTTSTSFTIVNNCRVKGNDEESIVLKTLRAKISNTKDQYGYYTLTVDGRTITLSEGSYTTLLNDLSPGEHFAILTYYSLDKKFGDIETKIFINGQVETNDGLEYVNTSPKDIAFTTNIAIRKIQDCIEFYDDGKKINQMLVIPTEVNDFATKEITVKNKCSDLGKFKLQFCASANGVPRYWEGCQEIRYNNLEGPDNDTLTFDLGDDSLVAGIKKPEIPGGYIIPVKVAILNNNGREITRVYKNLKVNVYGSKGLYMEDPFIEVDKVGSIYQSSTVKLLNSDINTTPWDYATDNSGTGFSKYMSTGEDRPYFEKMLFNAQNNLTNQKGAGAQWWNYWAGGSATLATGTIVVGVATSIFSAGAGASAVLGPLTSLFGPEILVALLAMPGYGWAIVGVVAIGGWITSTWHNDYQFDPYYQVLDVNPNYTMPDMELDKTINISSSGSQTEFINVFDITGARYFTYLKLIGKTHGSPNKLTSDVMMDTDMPKCNGKQHQELYDTYKKIIDHENCNDTFNIYEVTDDQIKAGVECYGRKPTKNKINLNFEVYTACKYDETIWPEQAGIKPIKFIISDDNAVDRLNTGDTVYKVIKFKPTVDENGSDSAFGDSEIGDFRFAIISKQYPENPDVDLNMVDCFTDAGKVGKTGPGAIPKVSFDWTWNSNINNCSDGNKFCDSAQLSQTIVNRIISADTQITAKRNANKIACPKSTGQAIDSTLSGSYNLVSTNPEWSSEVPIGYTGIQEVRFGTDGNKTKIKVTVQNRTGAIQSGIINLRFGDYIPKSQESLDDSGSLILTPLTSIVPIQTITTTIPSGEDDSVYYTFIYEGTNGQPIVANNIPLEVNYLGTNAYDSESYTFYQTDINASIHHASTSTACQVPATTAQFNGVDYIDMWFNESQYPENVIDDRNWSIEDIRTLKNTLEFDAYLITDNYNQQFLNDFDAAYGGKASLGNTSATSWFVNVPDRYQNDFYSPLFRDNTTFIQKYTTSSNGINLLVPGKYKVRIDFIYNNDEWKLTNENEDIDANVTVTLTYIRGPENDNVFYRMPFDGFLGLQNNGNYTRQNYGLGYLGDSVTIYHSGSGSNLQDLTTDYSGTSNPKKYLNVEFNKDLFRVNSKVETRGNLLTVKEKSDNQIEMTYSPNVATPILMKVKRSNLLPFTVYYQLQNNNTNEIMTGGSSLGVWSGVGTDKTLDFSGDYVYSKFMNFYDRQTEPDEKVYNSYAIDWDNIARTGTVYLRTIFYTPYGNQDSPLPIKYTLTSKFPRGQTNNMQFSTTGGASDFSYQEELGTGDYRIDSVNQLFTEVSAGNVCVVNTENGKVTEFYWNPKKIYENPSYNGAYNGEGLEGLINN